MKIMLDCSPAKIVEYSERYSFAFWQLRTPLTQYARAEGVPYALDNGCFRAFDKARWERMLAAAASDRPVFVSLPDVVGDAMRTAELFEHFKPCTTEVPRALVLQDGIERVPIPWTDIAAVFIGGSDQFKCSREAINAARVARMLDKWVHVGRVNTAARLRNWMALADSIDGSGISRFDHMLESVLAEIAGTNPQHCLEIHEAVPQ